MKKLEEKIKELIADVVEIEVNNVQDQAHLCDDLGADSLDYVEILLRLEKELSVRITDTEAMKLKTVENLINFVRMKLTT